MARIFTEDFDTGTPGTNITTANTGFNYVSGGPRFSTAAALDGPVGMESAPSGYGAMPVGGRTTLYMRAYVRYMTLGTIAWHWNLLTPAPAVAATLRVNANGTLRIMPGSSGTILQSTAALVAGEWARLEWGITGSTMTLRMFTGANVHGTTPDYESTPTAWTGTTVNASQIGDLSSSGLGVHVDGLAIDDSTWVGPVDVPDPEPATAWFVDDGTQWHPAVLHYDTGVEWVNLDTGGPGETPDFGKYDTSTYGTAIYG